MDPAVLFSQFQTWIASQGQAAPPTNAALPPPPVGQFVSSRTPGLPPSSRGHPNVASALPSSAAFQPILGTSSLGVSMSANTNQSRHSSVSTRPTTSQISNANTSRMAAAAAHLPHPPALVPRQSRRRGAAQPTPTLPVAQHLPGSVYAPDLLSGGRNICIEVHVYLPTVCLLSSESI
jgi:hypothetical protein